MVDDERSLPAGGCACGSLQAGRAHPRDPHPQRTAAPAGALRRAAIETLVSVPVRLQERMLGEINLFFRTPVTLSADEPELLDALASHLASALEGLRAGALEREAAVAEERALLARELHDSIAQSPGLPEDPGAAAARRRSTARAGRTRCERAVDELDVGVRESIGDVRELLVHFRTRTNTDDIEPALQETLQKFEHQTGLATHLSVQGQGLPLPSDVQCLP